MGGEMISPHTPPGTKVVYWRKAERISFPLKDRIKVGDVLTVVRIGEDPWFDGGSNGFYAEVAEHPHEQIGLRLLRYPELPRELSDCLTSQPLLVDELTGEATGDKCAPPVVTARGLR
jgi:hypothetical protein